LRDLGVERSEVKPAERQKASLKQEAPPLIRWSGSPLFFKRSFLFEETLSVNRNKKG
jgi:hypothetical protein